MRDSSTPLRFAQNEIWGMLREVRDEGRDWVPACSEDTGGAGGSRTTPTGRGAREEEAAPDDEILRLRCASLRMKCGGCCVRW